jgi:hypothetical protein
MVAQLKIHTCLIISMDFFTLFNFFPKILLVIIYYLSA